MSVEQLGAVLHHSRATGTDKLVLLGIANHAGDGGAWPAVTTLARYANVSERSVQRSLSRLIELGELHRHVQQGGLAGWDDFTRPNRYDVLVECPEGCAGGSQHRPRRGWEYDHELREYVRLVDDGQHQPVEDVHPLSTGDTPDVQNHATRRAEGVTQTSPGDADVTRGVTHTSPKPPSNHTSAAPVSAQRPVGARRDSDERVSRPQLDSVRESLRASTARHRAVDRGQSHDVD